MNFLEVHKAITARLEANRGSTTVAYDNAAFTPPRDTLWARATILPGSRERANAGVPVRYRLPGVLVLQIFDRAELGDGRAIEEVDRLGAVFESVTAGGVVYMTPYLVRVGVDNDGWYQINLNCPWYSDEV